MSLRAFAVRCSERLNSLAGRSDPYQKAFTAFALEGFLAMVYSTLLFCLAGWLVGAFWETVAVAAASAALKIFAGGAHLGTPTRCALSGAVFLAGLGYLAAHFPGNGGKALFLFLLILDNLLVWVRAPVESPGKPLAEKQRIVLGILARLVIALETLAWFLLPPGPWPRAMVLGATAASLGLSKEAGRILAAFDRALDTIRMPRGAAGGGNGRDLGAR